MRTDGGKNGAGVYQFIINRIPPHKVFIEPFLRSGAILRHKKPAKLNIGSDIDPKIVASWENNPVLRAYRNKSGYIIVELDFFDIFETIDYLTEQGPYRPANFFLYLDPPYLIETRRSSRPLYDFEMSREQHIRMLEIITTRTERIMLSGYQSELYTDYLATWRHETFQSMTHRGKATESLWMNYPQPTELHDYRFLGVDFTDRQRIARKIDRWVKRLQGLPTLERAAILKAITSTTDSGPPREKQL